MEMNEIATEFKTKRHFVISEEREMVTEDERIKAKEFHHVSFFVMPVRKGLECHIKIMDVGEKKEILALALAKNVIYKQMNSSLHLMEAAIIKAVHEEISGVNEKKETPKNCPRLTASLSKNNYGRGNHHATLIYKKLGTMEEIEKIAEMWGVTYVKTDYKKLEAYINSEFLKGLNTYNLGQR
jgi:hypothetical protein